MKQLKWTDQYSRNYCWLDSEWPCTRLHPGLIISRAYRLRKQYMKAISVRSDLACCSTIYHAATQWSTGLWEPVGRAISKQNLRDTFCIVDTVNSLTVEVEDSFSVGRFIFNWCPPSIGETVNCVYEFARETTNSCLSVDELRRFPLASICSVKFKLDELICGHSYHLAIGSLVSEFLMSKLENKQ